MTAKYKATFLCILLLLSVLLCCCAPEQPDGGSSPNEGNVSLPLFSDDGVTDESDIPVPTPGGFAVTVVEQPNVGKMIISFFIRRSDGAAFEYDLAYTLEKKNADGNYEQMKFADDYGVKGALSRALPLANGTVEGPMSIYASDFGLDSGFEKGEYRLVKNIYDETLYCEFEIK